MRWINHKITTFSLVYLLTQDIVPSIIAASGSIIPDAVEGHNYDSEKWKRRHRRLSHWTLGYLLIALALFIFVKVNMGVNLFNVPVFKVIAKYGITNSDVLTLLITYFLFFCIVGCILHILEDSLSSSVPLIHPKKRTFSIGIMKVGSFSEYTLSFALLIFAIFAK